MLHSPKPDCQCDFCQGRHNPIGRWPCPECGSVTCAKAIEHWMQCSKTVQNRNRKGKHNGK